MFVRWLIASRGEKTTQEAQQQLLARWQKSIAAYGWPVPAASMRQMHQVACTPTRKDLADAAAARSAAVTPAAIVAAIPAAQAPAAGSMPTGTDAEAALTSEQRSSPKTRNRGGRPRLAASGKCQAFSCGRRSRRLRLQRFASAGLLDESSIFPYGQTACGTNATKRTGRFEIRHSPFDVARLSRTRRSARGGRHAPQAQARHATVATWATRRFCCHHPRFQSEVYYR